jgi:hypothetical protein
MPFLCYLGTFLGGWYFGGLVGRWADKAIIYEMSLLPQSDRERAIAAMRANPHLDLSERTYARMLTVPMPQWVQPYANDVRHVDPNVEAAADDLEDADDADVGGLS